MSINFGSSGLNSLLSTANSFQGSGLPVTGGTQFGVQDPSQAGALTQGALLPAGTGASLNGFTGFDPASSLSLMGVSDPSAGFVDPSFGLSSAAFQQNAVAPAAPTSLASASLGVGGLTADQFANQFGTGPLGSNLVSGAPVLNSASVLPNVPIQTSAPGFPTDPVNQLSALALPGAVAPGAPQVQAQPNILQQLGIEQQQQVSPQFPQQLSTVQDQAPSGDMAAFTQLFQFVIALLPALISRLSAAKTPDAIELTDPTPDDPELTMNPEDPAPEKTDNETRPDPTPEAENPPTPTPQTDSVTAYTRSDFITNSGLTAQIVTDPGGDSTAAMQSIQDKVMNSLYRIANPGATAADRSHPDATYLTRDDLNKVIKSPDATQAQQKMAKTLLDGLDNGAIDGNLPSLDIGGEGTVGANPKNDRIENQELIKWLNPAYAVPSVAADKGTLLKNNWATYRASHSNPTVGLGTFIGNIERVSGQAVDGQIDRTDLENALRYSPGTGTGTGPVLNADDLAMVNFLLENDNLSQLAAEPGASGTPAGALDSTKLNFLSTQ